MKNEKYNSVTAAREPQCRNGVIREASIVRRVHWSIVATYIYYIWSLASGV